MADSLKIQLEKTKLQFDRTVKDMQLEQNKMQEIIDGLNSELIKLKQENKALKSSVSLAKISLSDNEIIKKILTFYAKGYTYKTINEKMKFNKFDLTIDFIKETCQNIEDLDNEFILHYKKEVEAYEEQLKIKPDLIKDQLAQILQTLINDASMDLDTMNDPVEKTKLRKEINDHAKELNKLLGNIVAEKGVENEISKEVQDMKDQIKNNAKILRIGNENVKVV